MPVHVHGLQAAAGEKRTREGKTAQRKQRKDARTTTREGKKDEAAKRVAAIDAFRDALQVCADATPGSKPALSIAAGRQEGYTRDFLSGTKNKTPDVMLLRAAVERWPSLSAIAAPAILLLDSKEQEQAEIVSLVQLAASDARASPEDVMLRWKDPESQLHQLLERLITEPDPFVRNAMAQHHQPGSTFVSALKAAPGARDHVCSHCGHPFTTAAGLSNHGCLVVLQQKAVDMEPWPVALQLAKLLPSKTYLAGLLIRAALLDTASPLHEQAHALIKQKAALLEECAGGLEQTLRLFKFQARKGAIGILTECLQLEVGERVAHVEDSVVPTELRPAARVYQLLEGPTRLLSTFSAELLAAAGHTKEWTQGDGSETHGLTTKHFVSYAATTVCFEKASELNLSPTVALMNDCRFGALRNASWNEGHHCPDSEVVALVDEHLDEARPIFERFMELLDQYPSHNFGGGSIMAGNPLKAHLGYDGGEPLYSITFQRCCSKDTASTPGSFQHALAHLTFEDMRLGRCMAQLSNTCTSASVLY